MEISVPLMRCCISTKHCPEAKNYKIGEKMSGMCSYEIVSKGENGCEMRLKSFIVSPKKRMN
jgi:hypothetical protein